MNKLKIVLSALLLLMSTLLITSCGEEDEPTNNPPGENPTGKFMNCRVIEIKRGTVSDVYTYNDDGKLIFFVDGNADLEHFYSGNTTTIKYYYNGEHQRTETVTNNGAGFATHIKATYESETIPTKFTDFIYDEKNQLIKKTVQNEGETDEDHTVYQWLDGNMVAETDLDNDDMTTYAYDSELTQPAEYFNEQNISRGYVTIQTKNRMIKVTHPSGATHALSYIEDDDGRIETVIVTPSNNSQYTKKYSYECD